MEFKYCNNPDAEIPIFCIEEQVGTTAGEKKEEEKVEDGIIGSKFAEELKFIDGLGKKRIEIHINSQGGFVKDGYSIFYSISNAKTPISTICTGMAASIAGIIFVAGEEREMVDYGFLMIHNPFGGDDESLKLMRDGLVTILSKRSGQSEKDISDMMDKETYLSAKQAKDLGFCDKILVTKASNSLKEELLAIIKTKPNAAQIQNKLTDIKNDLNKPITMKKVISFLNAKCKLDLDTEAAESEVLAAVKNLLTAKNEAEDKASDAEEKMEKMKKKMEGMEEDSAEYKKLKKEMDDLKKEAKDMEEADKAEDSEKCIDAAIKAGKVKAESKANWKKMFLVDPVSTKALIDDLAGSKTAPKIAAENIEEGAPKGGYMGRAMAKRLGKLTGEKE